MATDYQDQAAGYWRGMTQLKVKLKTKWKTLEATNSSKMLSAKIILGLKYLGTKMM